jgi:hypothetical protein
MNAGQRRGQAMGNEIKGAVKTGGNRHLGKILLETSEILFRGETFRLRIPFAEIRGVSVQDSELLVKTRNGLAAFEIGSAAEKWRDKILHPKSRAEKLGIKPALRIHLAGVFDAAFVRELKAARAEILDARSSGSPAVVFLSIEAKNQQAAIQQQAKQLKGDQALWVVYPKGKKEITENDVIAAGRKAALKDVKVVSFSATHTALKFVIPLAKR